MVLLGEYAFAKASRCASTSRAVALALVVPRRLGGLAEAHDLAADKKALRRLYHLMMWVGREWEKDADGGVMWQVDPTEEEQALSQLLVVLDFVDQERAAVEADMEAVVPQLDKRAANRARHRFGLEVAGYDRIVSVYETS